MYKVYIGKRFYQSDYDFWQKDVGFGSNEQNFYQYTTTENDIYSSYTEIVNFYFILFFFTVNAQTFK